MYKRQALVRLQVVVEHTMPAEDARVLGIQAEHQTDAQHIQTFQRFLVARVLVLLQKRVIENAHQFTCLQGNLHFLSHILVPGVHQEL